MDTHWLQPYYRICRNGNTAVDKASQSNLKGCSRLKDQLVKHGVGRSMKWLDLSRSPLVTDAVFAFLAARVDKSDAARFPLHHLNLAACPNVSSAGLLCLPTIFPNLASVKAHSLPTWPLPSVD